ncbi:S1/P1 nuclease [Bradyrhizobium sp. CCBAU 51627]|uniref:S1/P1 nuclease n=1 Tax=Bradyrhizobium sp. CCBAU 51627 TaxID=1325088 RepID=UPI0023064A63|nr:S1/P1 nuclease [Bradyrhizobium sp. CCBAU 51627]MDA9435416.1 hypothetical protein [Bradyrhizobium sp. CCBAU 51627]
MTAAGVTRRKQTCRYALFALVMGAIWPSSAWAWGQLGHSVIAELAQRHLNSRTLAALKELIGETSLASISNWADDYKFTEQGKGTYRWHFVDIDISHPAYGEADCPEKNNQGNCIAKGLPIAIATLKDRTKPIRERRDALRLVVHLIGDLGQPLHASCNGDDGGGNTLFVSLQAKRQDGKSYRRSSSFHSMWDDSLIELQAYSWGSYADALDGIALPPAEGGPYDEARIAAWANDTHALGIKAYQLLPAGTPAANDPAHAVELGDAYAAAAP